MNLFQNALLFEPQNISMLVLLMSSGVWLVLALTLVIDLVGDSGLAKVWKFVWLPVICLPLIGGLAYGAFCFLRAVVKSQRQ